MSEETPITAPITPVSPIDERVKIACDIAAGRTPAPMNDAGISIIAAKKDLDCKGRGPIWYRMVYRNGNWTYVSSDRLPSGAFRAADRRAEVSGEVFPGEIVVSHDKGGPVDCAWLVLSLKEGKCLKVIESVVKQRDGKLRFTLPDCTELVLPNPRNK